MALTGDLWTTQFVSRLFHGLCCNDLLFSFQKVRAASAGALPKRRNSKLFLGKTVTNHVHAIFCLVSRGMDGDAGLNTVSLGHFPS